MKVRLQKQDWAMSMALITARRSTCARRHVGCVLVDKDYYILATGYNGVAKGMDHCNLLLGNDLPFACPGATAPSGTNLDGCHAIHAEQNALLRCSDPREIYACFCTASPCMTCVKLLMNTGCQKIFFNERYPHSAAEDLWHRTRREPDSWIHWPVNLNRILGETA